VQGSCPHLGLCTPICSNTPWQLVYRSNWGIRRAKLQLTSLALSACARTARTTDWMFSDTLAQLAVLTWTMAIWKSDRAIRRLLATSSMNDVGVLFTKHCSYPPSLTHRSAALACTDCCSWWGCVWPVGLSYFYRTNTIPNLCNLTCLTPRVPWPWRWPESSQCASIFV
jgi:hypothetical protein